MKTDFKKSSVHLGTQKPKDYVTEFKDSFGPKITVGNVKLSRDHRKNNYEFKYGTHDTELLKKRNTLAYVG